MKLALCTISFRHELISLQQLASWANTRGFSAIELWAPHARTLQPSIELDEKGLIAGKLPVSMISDYLPLQATPSDLKERSIASSRLAGRWHVELLRTFAGNLASQNISAEDRRYFTKQLREAAIIADDHGIKLLIETHPDTLADTLASTLQLLDEVDHNALGINFDFLHVWEGGDDPIEAYFALKDKVHYYHLKNVTDHGKLDVFHSSNVYSPAGSRLGMVPLFNGIVDYHRLFATILQHSNNYGSLEWFGEDTARVLEADAKLLACEQLRSLKVS